MFVVYSVIAGDLYRITNNYLLEELHPNTMEVLFSSTERKHIELNLSQGTFDNLDDAVKEVFKQLNDLSQMIMDDIDNGDGEQWEDYLDSEREKKAVQSGHMGEYEWMLESNR